MEYHVKKTGSDLNPGTESEPFRTISKAAYLAKRGDTVTVHEGVYREWVSPKSGGTHAQRIIYQAAAGEQVTITGAEEITDWVKDGDIWKTEISNSFFGKFNPFAERLFGDWFFTQDRLFHLGEVYLNGRSLYEMTSIEDVRNPKISETSKDPDFSIYTWFADVKEDTTVLYANFQGSDPTKETVEINVRPFCFWPAKPGCGYITVRGFTMKQAATQWAPPTALQEGLVGPHWSKGWIIEDNIISESKCCGISLGKEESTGQNEWMDLQTKMGHQREQEVIFRAVNNGWNKDNIGSHIVRGNVIYNCGQAGIVGHLGCVFSRIENNHIYNTRYKREFEGAEVGGIKLHAAIDTVIKNNVIHDSFRGIWLDWQGQGTHVCGNTIFGNDSEDMLVEVSHGPTMIDHNLMLSRSSFKSLGHSCALVHNLIAGTITTGNELNRHTPYHVPHSTSIAGMMRFVGGDDRCYNNIFIREAGDTRSDEPRYENFWDNAPIAEEDLPNHWSAVIGYPVGTASYNKCPTPEKAKEIKMQKPSYASLSAPKPVPVYLADNVYFNKALPCKNETGAKVYPTSGVDWNIDRENKKVVITVTAPELLTQNAARIITTEILGFSFQSEQLFENPDGTPYVFDEDFTGKPRGDKAVPGPFQVSGEEAFEVSFA